MSPAPSSFQHYWTSMAVSSMAERFQLLDSPSDDPFWIFNPSYQALIKNQIAFLNLLSSTYASSPALSFLPFVLLNLIQHLSPMEHSCSHHLHRLLLSWIWCASIASVPSLSPAPDLMSQPIDISSHRGKEVATSADSARPKFTLRSTGLPPNRLFLLARVLGAKKVIDRFFFPAMKSAWHPEGIFEHAQIEENLFLFSFSESKDLQRVVDGSPWDYDSKSKWVIIKPVSGADQFFSIPLNEICVSVRIHDLPFEFRDDYNLSGIAESVGMRVVSMDDPNTCRDFVQFRCWIDVGKPLVDKIELPTDHGQVLSLPFTYENLPTFCYYCGILGHGFKNCAKWNQASSSDAAALPYSASLRAVDFGQQSQVSRHSPFKASGSRRTFPRSAGRSPEPQVTGGQASLIRSPGKSDRQAHTDGKRSSVVINEPLLDKVLFQVKELLIGKESRVFNSPPNSKMLHLLDSAKPAILTKSADGLPLNPAPMTGLYHDPQAHIMIPGIGLLGAGPNSSTTAHAGLQLGKPNSPTKPIPIVSLNSLDADAVPHHHDANQVTTPLDSFPTSAARRLSLSPVGFRHPYRSATPGPSDQFSIAETSKSSARRSTPFYSPIRSVRGLSSPGLSWSPQFDDTDSASAQAKPADYSAPASDSAATVLRATFSISPVSENKGQVLSPTDSPAPDLFPFSNSSMKKGVFEFTAVPPKEKGHLTYDSTYINAVNSVLECDVSPAGSKRSAVMISDITEPVKRRKNNEAGPVLLERYSRNRIKTKSKAYNKRQALILSTAGHTPLHLPDTVSSLGEDSPLEVNPSHRPEAAVASQPRLDQ